MIFTTVITCHHATCVRLGKTNNKTTPKTAVHTTDRPVQLVYTGLLGPISPPALGGFRYVSKFMDQHSNRKEVFLIKEKGRCGEYTQTVCPGRCHSARHEDGASLHGLGGGEYTAGYLEKYCLHTGIFHEFAATNTPQQNGVSERDGRTIISIARYLRKDAGFPKSLWGEMSFTATYLANRMPRSTLRAPLASLLFHGTLRPARQAGPPPLDRARTFVHIETHMSKLEDKAWERKTLRIQHER